jgi:hypothetical protein
MPATAPRPPLSEREAVFDRIPWSHSIESHGRNLPNPQIGENAVFEMWFSSKQNSLEQQAAGYYALGIATAMLSRPEQPCFTKSQLDYLMGSHAFEHQSLFDEGVRILTDAGVVKVSQDAFGPNLYWRMPNLTEQWLRVAAYAPIFQTYAGIGDRRWLADAITNVNVRYGQFKYVRSSRLRKLKMFLFFVFGLLFLLAVFAGIR